MPTFVYVSRGLFVTGSKKQNNIQTHEELSGFITNVAFEDADYDGNSYRKIIITVTDPEDGKPYHLGISVNNGYGSRIQKMLPCVDFGDQVSISLAYEEDTKKCSAFIRQSTGQVKQYWTKDDKKDLPEMECQEFAGKKMWDASKQNEYLEEFLTGPVLDQVKLANEARGPIAEKTAPSSGGGDMDYAEEPPSGEDLMSDGQGFGDSDPF